MIKLIAVALILTVGCMCVGYAELSDDDRAAVRADLDGQVADLVAAYQLSDALYRDGIGKSDAATSGGLGWSESSYLRNYMMCWYAVRDPYWLDKMIDHTDRMFGNLSDHDGDGLLSWQDIVYSVGLVDVTRLEPVGEGITVATPNGDRRVYYRRGGKDITGHDYLIEFIAADRFRFTDQTSGEALGEVEYADPTSFELMPGNALKVTGAGVAGAKFLIKTVAPEPCEYQVHDGMVTYPIAQFIEEVYAAEGLDPKYRAKADEYLAILHKDFVMRWERWWKPVSEDTGVYVFTDNPTQRFPLYSLPHNQYLAPARTLLVLADLAMARFEAGNRPASMVPPLCWLYWRIAGVREDQRELALANTATVIELTGGEGLMNPGFETRGLDGSGAAGWAFFRWSETSSDNVLKWTTDAHSGEHAIAIVGVGEKVNIGVQAQTTITVQPPATVTLSAWYKAEAGTRAYFSIIAIDAAGERAQYDNSPVFAATDEWTQATWTVEMHEDARSIQALLRNGAAGRISWDDVEMTIE